MSLFTRIQPGRALLAPVLFALSCAPQPGAAGIAPVAPVVATDTPAASTEPASAAPAYEPRELDPVEKAIVAHVDASAARAEALLEQVVNINSGTMNHEGVRRVGDVFAEAFEALGFASRWIPMDHVNRAGHLFATRRGNRGKRLLLIGHLDTVFEKDSPFQRYERLENGGVRGPGTIDMKGGDVVIVQALEALYRAGALDGVTITVALTGDEENSGEPLEVARKDLLDAARESDVALGFEGGVGGVNTATVARRGYTDWTLTVRGRRGHSSGIFSEELGAGAMFEAARILKGFYDELGGEPYLTFNAGLIVGGTAIEFSGEQSRGTAFGKSNVIPQEVRVAGEMRALTVEQRERAKERMRSIVRKNLPQTSAELVFSDGYPPMAPTEGNRALFAELDRVTRDMGLGPVTMVDPGARGAADISMVAPYVDCLAGLGVSGTGAHTTDEVMDGATLTVATKRAALLIYRLTR